jgi:pimeloyl-ACP methyl ester carboxylesterase
MLKREIKVFNEVYHYLDEGDKDVLLLIHGNMSSSLHFQPIWDELKKDYRVIAPDMRGFGDSTYHKPIQSLEDLSKDLLEFLRQLKITSCTVLGWSTGGAVALKMAALQPETIKGVILVESCSYRGYPIYKKDANYQPVLNSFYDSKEEMANDPVQVKPMVDVFETGNKQMMKAVWDQAIYTVNKPKEEQSELFLTETMKQRNIVDIDYALTTFNMSNFTNGVTLGDDSIKDVTCKVLSIWGEKDIVVLEYMVDETVEALSNVKKVTLQNSGHNPFIDQPKEMIRLIKEFTS